MMTLDEHHASLPGELRVTPEKLPPDIAEAFAYAAERDALLDAGTPADQLPTYAEWRS